MAMSINELRTKRASLWEETKKFLAEHTDKDGKMAAADAEAYEKMEADIAEMGKTIDRLEKQAEMGRPANRKRKARLPMNTARRCLPRSVPSSAMYPTYCRRVSTKQAAIWCLTNTTAA